MRVQGHVHEKYRLGPRLGTGGMADVFRAELTGAEGFSRPVAIKRLHSAVSADPAFCAMFVREAQLLSALHHPNIVSVLDFDWDADGRLFLVMELVDGVTLSQLVQRGPLPPAVAVHVMAEVLRGLGHAHARGILHRDVTPHNVLLGWTGEVKLSDFGLAQASASSRVSDAGLIRGKVPYLSPEQLQGLTIDARSDLFSVGVMSYQLLTGRYPFLGRTDQATMAESIARMLTATIVPPRDLRPEIPAALSDVVMHLLERERERRFMSADMVLADMPAPEHGRDTLIDLLAERFPGGIASSTASGTIDLASADTWPVAGDQARLAPGQASDPWFRRHTVSLPGVRAQAEQPGGQEQVTRARRRWWPGLPLVLAALLLAWVVGMEQPRPGGAPKGSAAGAAAGAAASGLEQALPDAGHAGRAGRIERLPAPGMSPATAASTPVAAETSAGAAAHEPPARAPGQEPGHQDGHSPGHAAGNLARQGLGSSRAGRAQSRPAVQRVRAAAASAGTETGTRVGTPIGAPISASASEPEPTPPAPAPVQAPVSAPAEQRYERGWTEVEPQQTLTGEVPIQREVP